VKKWDAAVAMGANTVVVTVAAIHQPTMRELANARIDERVDGQRLAISIGRLTD
jgi:hypothetical protein